MRDEIVATAARLDQVHGLTIEFIRQIGAFRIVEELCGAAVSKSQVSVLCQTLDPLVADWRTRRLDAQAYPFVLVDALVMKVRLDGRVRQQALLIATGVRVDGYREILGFSVDERKSIMS